MANDKAAPVFMDLPLEVRHCIFEYAAARDIKSKKLLRYWFEKKEAKETIAQIAAQSPNGPTPRVHWSDDREYGDESDEAEEEEDEEDEGVEEQDSEDEDNEDEGEQDEDGEDDDQDEEEQDGEEQEAQGDGEEDEEETLNGSQANQPATASYQVPVPVPAQASAKPAPSAQATTQLDQSAQVDEEEQAEDEMEVDSDEAQEEEEQEDEAKTQDTQADAEEESDGDGAEEIAEDDGGVDVTTAPPQQPPPLAPVIHAHRKWRHIPNFMRLTQCPPPVELLLTSKQLNTEAKNWFYDVAVLRIDATGSFAHTSFFEEAFRQIADAAFSPLENIRKVEVTFVWDSTWIRADTSGCVGAIFPALLGQRSSFVYQILQQAPDLKEVIINWHDSAQDNESANFMMDHLSRFHALPATITIKEHYIAVDAKPRKSSIAGKRRVEFQNILDIGLDRLF